MDLTTKAKMIWIEDPLFESQHIIETVEPTAKGIMALIKREFDSGPTIYYKDEPILTHSTAIVRTTAFGLPLHCAVYVVPKPTQPIDYKTKISSFSKLNIQDGKAWFSMQLVTETADGDIAHPDCEFLEQALVHELAHCYRDIQNPDFADSKKGEQYAKIKSMLYKRGFEGSLATILYHMSPHEMNSNMAELNFILSSIDLTGKETTREIEKIFFESSVGIFYRQALDFYSDLKEHEPTQRELDAIRHLGFKDLDACLRRLRKLIRKFRKSSMAVISRHYPQCALQDPPAADA